MNARQRLLGLIAVAAALNPLGAQPVLAGEPRFELQVPVLYYHHIKCAPPDATITSLYECPEVFTEQMTYLRDHDWQAITVDDVADMMANHSCPNPRQFVVSFDDGALDAYDTAAPILESLGMHGSFFPTLGNVGGLRTGKFTFEQMRDLVARGHAIGNHTQNHLNLKVQSAEVVYEQIEVAQQRFESILGFRPRTLAYPYGRYNDAVIEQVRQSGLELAFSVRGGAREASDAPFISRRIMVKNTDSGAIVLSKLGMFADGCRRPTPDLAVKLATATAWKGDNVYAAAPWKVQTVTRRDAKLGETYQFTVRLQNDAQRAGRFSLRRSGSGAPGVNVRYSVAGVDVTTSVVAGAFSTLVEPWSAVTVDVSMKPTVMAATGTSHRVTMSAVSLDDASRIDVARLVLVF